MDVSVVVDEMRIHLDEPWGDLDTPSAQHGLLARLVDAFLDPSVPDGRRMLSWLVLHAARRSLVVWEYHCDGTVPQQTLEALRRWLAKGSAPPDLRWLLTPAGPSCSGYRLEDRALTYAGLAADGVAHAARYAAEGMPVDALRALLCADNAINLSMRGDDFHRWLIDVAAPAASARRDLTKAEQWAHRDFASADLPRWRAEQLAAGHLLYRLPP